MDFHAGVRLRVRKLTNARLLWVDDAAFDDGALMAARLKAGDSFITRHNLRREKPEILINLAMQKGQAHSPRPGKTVYTGCTLRDREEIGAVRLVYEVTERTSKKGQALLLPEYKVFSVWTDLEKVSDTDVLRLYRDRGTCEQYFAELKSELDLERLPSGKFSIITQSRKYLTIQAGFDTVIVWNLAMQESFLGHRQLVGREFAENVSSDKLTVPKIL